MQFSYWQCSYSNYANHCTLMGWQPLQTRIPWFFFFFIAYLSNSNRRNYINCFLKQNSWQKKKPTKTIWEYLSNRVSWLTFCLSENEASDCFFVLSNLCQTGWHLFLHMIGIYYQVFLRNRCLGLFESALFAN